jgi:hypothetical protein
MRCAILTFSHSLSSGWAVVASAFKLDKSCPIFCRILDSAHSDKDERVRKLAQDIELYIKTGDGNALKDYEIPSARKENDKTL